MHKGALASSHQIIINLKVGGYLERSIKALATVKPGSRLRLVVSFYSDLLVFS